MTITAVINKVLLLYMTIRLSAIVFFTSLILIGGSYLLVSLLDLREMNKQVIQSNQLLQIKTKFQKKQFASASAEINTLKSQDQRVRNNKLEKEIKNINNTYSESVKVFEKLVKLMESSEKTDELEELYTDTIVYLSDGKYASASAVLKELSGKIDVENARGAALAPNLANAPVHNSPPDSGFRRQRVKTEVGTFTVSVVAADLNTARVIIDTASEGDCHNECPVLSLGEYVSRNGAFAGINGSYFCPATYPGCAEKKNSFDTLLMNKNKVYFNSDNNKFSTVPAAIFYGSTARFVNRSLEWGRDTGVDAVIANQPLLVNGGNRVFGGDGDPKKGSKGSRSFIAAKGTNVYIGIVHGATVTESAYVLQALGMDNALNLDSGGSTALWSGGYRAGPGRNIPNAILFVR